MDADGGLTDQPAEPIAADLRPDKDSKRLVKLKVIAGLLGLGLDELVRRENQRRTQRLFWLSTGMAAAMMVMGVLTVFAVQSRNEAVIARDDAERQKTQAEDLIEFMLGDLRKKLEPVGRLDVLDSVGDRALKYFATLRPDEIDEGTLGRRFFRKDGRVPGRMCGRRQTQRAVSPAFPKNRSLRAIYATTPRQREGG